MTGMSIECVAFDCFGTVFDMSGVSSEEINDYVQHVRRSDFSPYQFPQSWWDLKLHEDSAVGVAKLQALGFKCWALSNGSKALLDHVSTNGGIQWDGIVDLVQHQVYKPHIDAYRTIEKETGIPPEKTLMVTANPGFGDIEGAGSIGMQTQVIRHGSPETITELAERMAV